ncbi:hypothetical protein [Moorena sp. SIO3A2]|uniref:hypothetical protein n=1 Tax=Moorena sp. SIO3A2 TaxID=2607841 RepID=UPI0013B8C51A|nr:hypothetical protein [Moorena sp. SIO3A2]NER90088.1 hypothetical protein [Moorena sp. SIO3A2]
MRYTGFFSTPDSRLPTPDSRFPIPVPLLGGVRGGFRFPIPDSRFPTFVTKLFKICYNI